jgi:hypothetical protein
MGREHALRGTVVLGHLSGDPRTDRDLLHNMPLTSVAKDR